MPDLYPNPHDEEGADAMSATPEEGASTGESPEEEDPNVSQR